MVEEVKRSLGENVYRSIIPRNVRLGEAPSHGLPIHLYDPKSKGQKAMVCWQKKSWKRSGTKWRRKKGLGAKGLGIEALIHNKMEDFESDGGGVLELDLHKIEPNRKQPRKHFDETAFGRTGNFFEKLRHDSACGGKEK